MRKGRAMVSIEEVIFTNAQGRWRFIVLPQAQPELTPEQQAMVDDALGPALESLDALKSSRLARMLQPRRAVKPRTDDDGTT